MMSLFAFLLFSPLRDSQLDKIISEEVSSFFVVCCARERACSLGQGFCKAIAHFWIPNLMEGWIFQEIVNFLSREHSVQLNQTTFFPLFQIKNILISKKAPKEYKINLGE